MVTNTPTERVVLSKESFELILKLLEEKATECANITSERRTRMEKQHTRANRDHFIEAHNQSCFVLQAIEELTRKRKL